jgi:hypothetical protein
MELDGERNKKDSSRWADVGLVGIDEAVHTREEDEGQQWMKK